MYWQDFRESYYRARAVRYSDSLLDSLNNGISSYEIAVNKLPELEFFKNEAMSGKKFNYNTKQARKANFSVNYFSTSIDWSGKISNSLKIISDISFADLSSEFPSSSRAL